MSRLGSSSGNGAGLSTSLVFAPANDHSARLQSRCSAGRISPRRPLDGRRYSAAWQTTIISVGLTTCGADGNSHEPQAVRRLMFDSFQVMLCLIVQPAS